MIMHCVADCCRGEFAVKLQVVIDEAEAACGKGSAKAQYEPTSALTHVNLTLRLNDLVNNVNLMKMRILGEKLLLRT